MAAKKEVQTFTRMSDVKPLSEERRRELFTINPPLTLKQLKANKAKKKYTFNPEKL